MSRCAVLFIALSLVGAGCGETTSRGSVGVAAAPASGGGGSDDGGKPSTQPGLAGNGPSPSGGGGQSSGSGGTGGSDVPQAGSSNSDVPSCESKGEEPPGVELTDFDAVGHGACADVTLLDAVEQARALRPDLVDITALYVSRPDVVGGDGSFIYAFERPDGGFALVFKRGSGDCPAGCINKDYWYFETDSDCQVEAIGETHPSSGECIPRDELPRWGIPRAPLPSAVCDADLSAQDLRGTYGVITCGKLQACVMSGEKMNEQPLSIALTLSIEQDETDLSRGTVAISGTGEPMLDGVEFPAKFEGRSFTVSTRSDDEPSSCINFWSLDWSYDFEGIGSRSLQFEHSHTRDCAKPDGYCKGYVSARFGDTFAPP